MRIGWLPTAPNDVTMAVMLVLMMVPKGSRQFLCNCCLEMLIVPQLCLVLVVLQVMKRPV